MRRWGVFLVVIGFGSVFLHYFTDLQFRVLAWADDRQPAVGIGVGLAGLLLLFGPMLLSIRKTRAATPSFPGTGPAPSTGGFAQPTPPNPSAPYARAPWGPAMRVPPAPFPPAPFPPAQPGPPLPGQFPPPRFDHPAPPSRPTPFPQPPGRSPQPPRWVEASIDQTVQLNQPIDRTVHLNQRPNGQFPQPGQR